MTERSDIHNSSIVNRQSSIPALPGWVFKQCKAEVYLKKANEALESLQ